MNKKSQTLLIILIIIFLILIAGLLIYLFLKPPQIKKCGDNICQLKEKIEKSCPQDCPLIIKEKTCSRQAGEICSSDETCSGSWLEASDTERCCDEDCEEIDESYCGDAVCDEGESCETCPEDCGECPIVSDYEDSPFGIWSGHANPFRQRGDPAIPDLSSMTDLGLHWSAPCNPALFSSDWTLWESYYNEYEGTGIRAVPMIQLMETDRGTGALEMSPIDYYNSMKETVSYFVDIDYWMLGVEVDASYNRGYISVEQYAMYIRLTYKALKDVRSTTKLATGGTTGNPQSYVDDGFFVLVFEELEELENIEKNPSSYNWDQNPYGLTQTDFDLVFAQDNYDKYMDIHHFSDFDLKYDASNYRKGTSDLVNAIENLLNNYGYDNVALWNTQTGTYSGQPTKPLKRYPYQTESEQSDDLIRKYIYSLVLGVKKIFWTTTYEFMWNNDAGEFFSNIGLIYNGQGDNDLGLGVKKLSYYTYKLMVEKLEGSDWNNIETVQESDNVYIYKFMKQGKPIWVAWWDYFEDSGTSKTITLNVGDINSVKITETVADAETGLDINENDYPSFFDTETKTVNNNKITITLTENPVFVEKME